MPRCAQTEIPAYLLSTLDARLSTHSLLCRHFLKELTKFKHRLIIPRHRLRGAGSSSPNTKIHALAMLERLAGILK